MPIYLSDFNTERVVNKNDIDIKTLAKIRAIAAKVKNEYIKDHRKLKEYILSLFKTAVVSGDSIGKLNELLLKEDPDYVHEHKHQYRFGNSITLYTSYNNELLYIIGSFDIFDSKGLEINLYKCMMMEFINKCNELLGQASIKNKSLTSYRFDIMGNYDKGKIVIVVRK